MTATLSVEAFVASVRGADVVHPDELDRYVERLRAARALPATAEELAGLLVRDGFLTQFQSRQFLANRWRGLTLGKYQVLERLGRGATGSVFLCKHPGLNRTVAIKVLPADAGGEAARLRFEREARAGAALSHPNVVKVFDYDRDGDLLYLVMEYAPGVTLHELVVRSGPLPVERAAHYARQAAAGLGHVHAAGLVHRDIKPANLLLDATGTVKILDLGLARFFQDESDQLTMDHESRRVLGTADYLAPEQALNSHGVDIRADLYGLGGTLYYLLTGRPPYGDGAAVQKLVWAQTRPPIPITTVRADLPAELVAVLERMMARDPAARYQTPAEVEAALEPWGRGPVPPPTLEELARDVDQVDSLSLRDLTGGSLARASAQGTGRRPAPSSNSAATVPPPAATVTGPRPAVAPSERLPRPAPPPPAAPAAPRPEVVATAMVPRPKLPGSAPGTALRPTAAKAPAPRPAAPAAKTPPRPAPARPAAADSLRRPAPKSPRATPPRKNRSWLVAVAVAAATLLLLIVVLGFALVAR